VTESGRKGPSNLKLLFLVRKRFTVQLQNNVEWIDRRQQRHRLTSNEFSRHPVTYSAGYLFFKMNIAPTSPSRGSLACSGT
jgi:hypothetical protein